MSSLFEDLDPESSPLMVHLEKKMKTGVTLTEEDFKEPYYFKKKMENEFNEIAERFKYISIENPEETISVTSDEDVFVIEMTESSSEGLNSETETLGSSQSLGTGFETDHFLENNESEFRESENRHLSNRQSRNVKNVKHSLICQIIFCVANEGLNICV